MNSLKLQNHGITVTLEHGANIGLGISKRDSEQLAAYAQIDYSDGDLVKEFLDRGSEELKRRKKLINAGAERNEQLRGYIKQLLAILNTYPTFKNRLQVNLIKQIEHELEL